MRTLLLLSALSVLTPALLSAQATAPPSTATATATASATVNPAEAGLQPRHVAEMRFAVEASISPDGQHVAYGLVVQRKPLLDENGPAFVELHVLSRDDPSRPYVAGRVSVRDIQWSHDSRRILYLAKRGDDQNVCLYAIPVDGGESTRLLQHGTSIGGYSLHPDGKQLAFLAEEEPDKGLKDLRERGFNQQIYEEDLTATHVWLASGLPDAKPRKLDLPGSASYVEWSPSGTELLVVLAPTSTVDDQFMYKRIHIVDVASGRIVESIKNPGKLGATHWSPDGKRIALVSGVDIHDPNEGRLMVADIPGGPLRDLMPNYQAHVLSFGWQDANTLVWTAEDHEETSLGRTTLDGNTRWLAQRSGPITQAFSLCKQQPLAAVVAHTPQHPAEVFRVDLNDGKASRLTDSNPWLAEIPLARQETIQWTARDGVQLAGVLIKPLHYVEGRRYPLIQVVHGGPESSVPNGWVTTYSNPGQMAAARGFMVFYPNYRGSTGRGVEFSKLGQMDAAGREFDDLVDGIDHLARIGLVDPAKVGITGGSYGGYASAWGSTYYSDRYAASVMFVGISDNVSKVGTTDIPEEMFLVHHRKRLWDDWNYFADRSPIRYVQRNKTPTLILHGKIDPRVHPSQSLELHRHLKTLEQAPVRLVLYEGEGHGNRQAASRFDYSLRLLQWMEHYLQGAGGKPPAYEIDYGAAIR
jgi:dipeptidyl aminopeptidase/acylaminoacyl peptidase